MAYAPTPLWANNDNTTLAAGITSAATTASLTNGTVLPTPPSGGFFALTFISATNPNIFEIVWVTGRSGNTITSMLRGQEGTAAQAFNAGDLANGLITAGSLASLAVLNGNPSQKFQVLGGTTANEAVNFSQFGFNGSVPGSFSLPSGLQVRWNQVGAGNGLPITFSPAFPNAGLMCVVSEGNANSGTWYTGGSPTIHASSNLTQFGYKAWSMFWTGNSWAFANASQNYIAIGF